MSTSAAATRPARTGPASWIWVALGSCVLMLVNLSFMGHPELELSATSYGKALDGFGAAYDLLHALRPAVRRSRSTYAALPPDTTLWFLQPNFLAPAAPFARAQTWLRDLDRDQLQEIEAWLERGGSALLFGGPHSDWQHFGLTLAKATSSKRASARGTIGPPRALELAHLQRFEANAAFTPVVSVDGAPLIVSKRVGRGTLVAIADARLFDNEHLDQSQHSNLIVDLARAYGAPRFDERSHGLLQERGLLAALGAPRLALLGLSVGLWALLGLLRARSVPPALLSAPRGPAPGLASFVDPLALLYSRKAPRSAAAVYRAYLHGLRYRLRCSFYGPRAGSDALLNQRLARDLAREPALRDELQGLRAPSNARELEDCVRRMERYRAAATHAQSRWGE